MQRKRIFAAKYHASIKLSAFLLKTMFKFIQLLVILGLSVVANAQKPTENTPKPTVFLTSKDTLYLSVEDGKKIVWHRVRSKQTLFSLSKFYALSLEELYEYNPDFETDPTLRVDDFVRIPTPNIAIKRYKKAGFVNSKNAPLIYVVQDGDNMFQICKRYFDMPVDSIMKRNGLKSNVLHKGQLLHMGWIGTEGYQQAWRKDSPKPTPETILRDRFSQQKAKYKEVASQGICHWNKDSREASHFYALHREAAIGTIVVVTNPANGRTTYAKVIGRIPPNYGNNTEVVLSPASAKRLGSAQTDFMIRIRFLK
jgi:LysM repeat protein